MHLIPDCQEVFVAKIFKICNIGAESLNGKQCLYGHRPQTPLVGVRPKPGSFGPYWPEVIASLCSLFLIPSTLHFFLLCLRLGRGGLLAVDGNGDIVLVLLADIGELHGSRETQLLCVHEGHQVRDKLIEPDIPLYLLDRHLVPFGHYLIGAFARVLRVNLARSAGALVLDGFKLHFQRLCPLTGKDFFTLV